MLTLTHPPKDHRIAVSTLAWALLAGAPVLVYGYFVSSLHHNLPVFDDYIIQLELARLKTAPTLLAKLHLLFGQLNEHRLVYTRFWFWLVHTLNGTISYSALIFVGNLPLLGIWACFAWLLRRLDGSWLLAVPLSWLLFQVNYHANSLWAMAALQNLTIHALYPLLFGLVTSPRQWAWRVSWLVAPLICFTSGNGFIALALAATALAYQRRWRHLLGWTGLFLGLILVYFGHYERPPDFPRVDVYTLWNKVAAMLMFLGLHADCYWTSSYNYHVVNGLVVCLPVGVLTIWNIGQLGSHWRTRKPMSQRHRVLVITLLMVGFITLSAGAAVVNRLSFMGWIGLLESRYRLYSTMLVLTGYVQLMALVIQQRGPADRLAWLILGVSILMWAGIYRHQISYAYLFRNRALAFYHNWTQLQPAATQAFVATVFTPSGAEAATLDQIRAHIPIDSAECPDSSLQLSTVVEQPEQYVIENNDLPVSPLPGEWTMLLLRTDSHCLLFPVLQTANPDWRSFWLNQVWFSDGFKAELIKWFMPAKHYQIGVLTQRNGALTTAMTSHCLAP